MHDTDPHDAVAEPIDMLEHCFGALGWTSERHGEDEIAAVGDGLWGKYELRALWREEESVLQIVSLLGLSAPEGVRPAAYELAGRINEQLWLGHFDVWSNDGAVLFRHAAMLGVEQEEVGLSLAQAEAFIDAALDECDRYYPAFNFVIEGTHGAVDALKAALIETAGEA